MYTFVHRQIAHLGKRVTAGFANERSDIVMGSLMYNEGLFPSKPIAKSKILSKTTFLMEITSSGRPRTILTLMDIDRR